MNQPDENLQIEGREYTILHHIFTVFSFGLFTLLQNYIDPLKYIFTRPCPLDRSNYVFLLDQKKIFKVQKIKIKKKSVALKNYMKNNEIRLLEIVYCRFLFDYSLNEYVNPRKYDYIDVENLDQLEKFIIFGENDVSIKEKSNFEIIFGRISDWIFVYEMAGTFLWYFNDYAYYATIILILNIYYLYTEIAKDFRMRMGNIPKRKVKVLKNKLESVVETQIFPGDVICLEVGEVVADIKILNGEVIVDESSLTGESAPSCRTPGSMLYAGTKILSSVGNGGIPKARKEQYIEKLRNIGLPKMAFKNTSSEKIVNLQENGLNVSENGKNLNTQEYELLRYSTIELAIGIVENTGFETYRGSLIRKILTSTSRKYKFMKQLQKLMLYLFLTSLIVCLLTYFYLKNELTSTAEALFQSLDMILIIFSPSLPTSINIGTTIFDRKLRKHKIFINDLSKTNSVASIQTAVFDKTGTLTNEDMDILCIDELNYLKNREIKNLEHKSENNEEFSDLEIYENVCKMIEFADKNHLSGIIRKCISTCHSIMKVNGILLGDPLDLKMFEFSNSEIKENKIFYYENDDSSDSMENKCRELEIIKRKEFTSVRRLMSVVVKDGDELFLFAKGSPETVEKICVDIPDNYNDVVNYYTLEGYRVISMAYKKLNSDSDELKSGGEYLETDLNFLGLLVLSNQLKSPTKSVIKKLKEGKFKCLMATGDGILTAISVGKQCELIDKDVPVIFPRISNINRSCDTIDWMCIGENDLYFDKVRLSVIDEDEDVHRNFVVACEGDLYEKIRNESEIYHNFLLNKGVIFSRMNPDQKKYLVEDLEAQGNNVCFCGDGANDCSALKAASISVALNDSQRYFSTFTSEQKDIESVYRVIIEGRAAFVTSISNLKFQLSAAGIQTIISILLITFKIFFSECQTTHYDIPIVVLSSLVIGTFSKSKKLYKNKPSVDIFSKKFLVPLLGHLFINLIFLTIAVIINKENNLENKTINKSTTAGTVTFFITIIQCLLALFFFVEGAPHCQSKYQNWKYIGFLICHFIVIIAIYILTFKSENINWFYDFVWEDNTIQNQSIFKNLHFQVFLLVFMNMLVSFIFHGGIFRILKRLGENKSYLQLKTEIYEEEYI